MCKKYVMVELFLCDVGAPHVGDGDIAVTVPFHMPNRQNVSFRTLFCSESPTGERSERTSLHHSFGLIILDKTLALLRSKDAFSNRFQTQCLANEKGHERFHIFLHAYPVSVSQFGPSMHLNNECPELKAKGLVGTKL